VAARETSANVPAGESAANGMSAAETAMASAAPSMTAPALGTHRDHRNCQEERREGNQATHKDIIRPFFPPEIAETRQQRSVSAEARKRDYFFLPLDAGFFAEDFLTGLATGLGAGF